MAAKDRGAREARNSREARERARVYEARKQLHDARQARRVRDNVIAGVGGGLLILAVIGGQIAYYTAGPGAPAPAPTTTPAPTTPAPTPEPTAQPTP